MARRKRKSGRSSRGSGMSPLKIAGYGVLYGALREPVSQLASRIPVVGDLGDEAAMMAVTGLAAWKGSGMIREIGKIGLAAEASAFGRGMAAGGLSLAGLGLGNSSSNAGGVEYQ